MKLSLLFASLVLLWANAKLPAQTLWSQKIWENHLISGAAKDTTDAIDVSHIDLRSLRLWGKAGGTNPNIKIVYQFMTDSSGWDSLNYKWVNHFTYEDWVYLSPMIPPRTKAVDKIGNPGHGRDFADTLSETKNKELISLNFKLTTSDSSANRYVEVIFEDSAGNPLAITQCSTPQPANTTREYVFFPCTPEIGSTNTNIYQAPLPPNLFLKGGAIIRSNIINIASEDSITNIYLGNLLDVDPVLDFIIPERANKLRFIVSGNSTNSSDAIISLVLNGTYY
jgi:hypothetical protein